MAPKTSPPSLLKTVLATVVSAAALTAAAGTVYQFFGSRRDRRKHQPLGRLVGEPGRRLHLHCGGAGFPAVILEAGIAGSCISWQPVQRRIEMFAHVCSYDRAGLGWSEELRNPRDLHAVVDDLRNALRIAGIASPYILVGHSFGGLVVRAMAAWYPEEVAGLVLVDPVRPADWINPPVSKRRRLAYGIMLSKRGAWLAPLGVVRASLALLTSGSRFVPKVIARATSGSGTSVIDRIVTQVTKLPQEFWPMIQAHWCQPRAFRAMTSYLTALPYAAAQVAAFEGIGVPVTILSAADATKEQLKEWNGLAETAPFGKHLQSESSGHWVQLDDPELVVNAVLEHVIRFRPSA